MGTAESIVGQNGGPMNWTLDAATTRAANDYPLKCLAGGPAHQFAGRNFRTRNWERRVQPGSAWPPGPLRSSPKQIIDLFADGDYLQALTMVVSWGTMWRRSAAIWGDRPLGDIEAALARAAESIRASDAIAEAWTELTAEDGLDWSPVITSKTLHFMCRGLGYDSDPPVAIDNAVILQRVWPAFVQPIPAGDRPRDWRGSGFDAYSRYMSAILAWAEKKDWQTTQVEATLFDAYH